MRTKVWYADRGQSQTSAEGSFEVSNKGGQTTLLVYPRKRGGYVFRYYVGGVGKTVERTSREKIVAEAKRIAAGIDAGSRHVGNLTAADLETLVHAQEQLALVEGGAPPLHAVVGEWIALRAAIGKTPVSEVIALWKRAGRKSPAAKAESSTLTALCAAYLEELQVRTAHSGTTRTLEGFRADLPRFCEKFGARPIAEVAVGEIADWLRGLGVGAKRHDNVRGELITLFRWARERGFLDEERKTEPEKVKRLYKPTKNISYWQPAEICLLLDHVSEKWLPVLALAAFTGMRPSEIGRLDWSAFDWEAARIYVRPNVALKKRQARRIPIPANLADWLEPFRQESGPLSGYKNFLNEWTGETERLKAATKMPWRANNLRHAYGSYMMALHDNYGQVAARMGTSEAKIKSNYDGVASPETAKNWQGIWRGAGGKAEIRRPDLEKVIKLSV